MTRLDVGDCFRPLTNVKDMMYVTVSQAYFTRLNTINSLEPMADLLKILERTTESIENFEEAIRIDRLQSTPSWLTFETHSNHKVSIHYF